MAGWIGSGQASAETRVRIVDPPPHATTEPRHARLWYAPPDARAGHPRHVARWAIPSITPRYSQGYIGGGATVFGQPRLLNEGTWGLDYTGSVVKRCVWLKWWHGRKHQGGGGSYKTDGPHLPKH